MNESYIQLYATYSKVYGPSTVIFLQVGKFYELYDLVDPQTGEGKTSMRRATELLNIQLSKKADGSLFAGVPEQSLHKYAQVLTREGWTVVVVDQVKNAAGDVTSRTPSRILSPGTHVETATTDSLFLASLWLQATEDDRPPLYAVSFLDLTTGEAVSTEGQTVGRSDAWSCDAILHLFQLYAPKEVVYSWRGVDYLLPDEQVLRSRLGVKGVFYRRGAAPAEQGSLETPYGREDYLRSVTSFRSILPLRTLLGVPFDGSSLVERSLCFLLRYVEDHFPGRGVTVRSASDSSHKGSSLPASAGSSVREAPAAHLLRHSMLHDAAAPAASGGTVYLGNNILEQVNLLPSAAARGAATQRSVLSLFEGRALTPMGKRSLRHRLLTPISSAAVLEQRYEAIDWFVRGGAAAAPAIESALRGMYDLPRLHTALAKGSLTTPMVSQLEQTYHHATALAATLANQQTPFTQDAALAASITSYLSQFSAVFPPNKPPLPPVLGLASPLSTAAGPRSAALESRAVALYAAWTAKYEAFLSWASVSAESLRLESRDEGLTLRASKGVLAAIELRLKSATLATKQHGGQPPFTQCVIQTRKSSSSSLECEELTRLREQLTALREEHARVQAEEIADACIPLWTTLLPFQTEWINWITSIDESQALARAAIQLSLVRPTLVGSLPSRTKDEPCEEGTEGTEGAAVELHGLRHPLIEAMATREAYVKHSISLGFQKANGLLVYGVNASGKSSLMKALAISVLLAQSGSFVPADSMRLRPFRSLYSRIWNQDNLFTGHSSFAVEMSELRDILRYSNEYSLVLGDEVCAGTESQSATALVASALEWLSTKRTCFLFATHLHDLLKVPDLLPRSSIEVCHLRVDIDRATGKLVYDRRLHPGPGSSLYGLEVARAMDIPLALIDRAHAIRRALAGEVAAEDAKQSQWNTALVRKSCEVCHTAITRDLEVHHIHPRAEGGGNALRNLIVVCSVCHDAHHAGKLQIGPLKLTSDGMERDGVTQQQDPEPATAQQEQQQEQKKTGKWSQEDLQIIHATLRTFSTFPVKRIVYELGKQGVQISESSTRAIRTKGRLG